MIGITESCKRNFRIDVFIYIYLFYLCFYFILLYFTLITFNFKWWQQLAEIGRSSSPKFSLRAFLCKILPKSIQLDRMFRSVRPTHPVHINQPTLATKPINMKIEVRAMAIYFSSDVCFAIFIGLNTTSWYDSIWITSSPVLFLFTMIETVCLIWNEIILTLLFLLLFLLCWLHWSWRGNLHRIVATISNVPRHKPRTVFHLLDVSLNKDSENQSNLNCFYLNYKLLFSLSRKLLNV